MKFQIGDRVVVMHSNEEGEVVDIINPKMVMVDVRGVKFPAYIDQLDFPYFKQFSQQKIVQPKKEKKYVDDLKKDKQPSPKVEDGVWISFIPVSDTDEFGDEVVETLKIHLINRTSTVYKFLYQLQFFGKQEFELKNELHPFSDFYLHDVNFADMSDSPAFFTELSLQPTQKGKADFFEHTLKLKPKQLFAKIDETREKGEGSFSYKILDRYPDKAVEESFDMSSLISKGIKVYSASRAREHLPPARSVVDLHIEKLVPDAENLNNTQKLGIQMREFEKWYDLAVAHRQPQLIVIHGIGKGVLRDEIHDVLRLKKEVKSFVNQFHPSFGYGATEIYFNYK